MAVGGFVVVSDFDEEFGTGPHGVLGAVFGNGQEGGSRGFKFAELRAEGGERPCGKTGADATTVDEAAAFGLAEQER